MLDLSILLKYLQGIASAPVKQLTELTEQDELIRYYGKDLEVEPGGAAYRITDEFLFCGKIVTGTGEVLLLGPVSGTEMTALDYQHILHRMGLQGRRAREIQIQLHHMPRMPLSVFLNQLGFLNYILNGETSLSLEKAVHSLPVSASAAVEPVFHNTEEMETYMLQCVEHGRKDLLEALWDAEAFQSQNMGDFSSDSITSLKYVFYTATSLAVRMANQGGLDYNMAMTLSDRYFHKSQDIVSYGSFQKLWKEMLLDLSGRVAELQLGGSQSPMVKKAVKAINGKLNQKITVADLAQSLGVSSTYLSHHFRRETCTSLTDYITRQKIGEAQRLMNTTSLSSAQIAYQLAFSSQSYFHAVFKKVTGKTPRAYRNAR